MKNLVIKNQKQGQVYNELADALEKVVPVLENFNGKVINVRLKKAMNEVLPKSINCCISYEYNKLSINLRNQENCYNVGTHWEYVWDCCTVQIIHLNKRLSYKLTKDEVQKQVEHLRTQAQNQIKACDDIPSIEKDYKNICNMIKEFNNKYHSSIREKFSFNRVY